VNSEFFKSIQKPVDDFLDSMNVRYQIITLRSIVEHGLEFFKDSNKEKIRTITKQFKDITGDVIVPDGALYHRGVKIANRHERVVCGGHGHYIEFLEHQLCFEPIIEKGQEWRATPKYQHVKYIWMTHPDLDIKIYFQMNKVKYADYKIGRYYIDILEIDKILFKKLDSGK